ncbi:MAG: heme o synthase [Chloroflexi bacterium]|nr:heme o synthase [Chloroflexota bacterium]
MARVVWQGDREQRWRDYLSLAKPRALALVVVTALAAALLATRGVSLWLLVVTLLGGGLAAAGANALNCYLDRDIDALMARTRRRPLPSGRLRPGEALTFGAGLTTLGVLVLGLGANWLAATLALAANAFYLAVYTALLKRRTPWNIVVGGLAGAAAPLIGWTAGGRPLDWLPLSLGALVLCWTPAHFWSLSLLVEDEYRAAGVPMWPVAFGPRATELQILLYAGLTVAVSLAPAVAGLLGRLYAGTALLLGAVLVASAWRQLSERDLLWTRRTFRFSIAYLGLICLAMVVDRLTA